MKKMKKNENNLNPFAPFEHLIYNNNRNGGFMGSEMYLPDDWTIEEIERLFEDFVVTFECEEEQQEFLLSYYSKLSKNGRSDMLDWMVDEIMEQRLHDFGRMCPN
jgi:hypothetical protein|tara:strand:+ start:136 stop:450 length:315 start_codon:yes stop_codon:yes gene_type:complete